MAVNVGFSGESCAICKGTASIMLEAIKGLEKKQILDTISLFKEFRSSWTSDDPRMKSFAPLSVLRSYPTRIKCLNLPWATLEAAVTKVQNKVTTE